MPTGRPSDAIAKDGSWRFRQRQGRGTNWHYGNVQHFLLHRQVREEETHHSKICVVRFLDSYRIIKMYSHFPAVHYVWCKDVKGAILCWVDFDESCQAWYHYKDFWACWESMRLSTLRRLAISSNGIKTYLLQSRWQGQYVLVIKNDNGRAPFLRGNYIISSSTNVDSMAFPQTSENTRGRGPKSISKWDFVRRKTYAPSFGRWKPALPTMKPWRHLGYAEMTCFSIGFPGPRWAVFIWKETSYG